MLRISNFFRECTHKKLLHTVARPSQAINEEVQIERNGVLLSLTQQKHV